MSRRILPQTKPQKRKTPIAGSAGGLLVFELRRQNAVIVPPFPRFKTPVLKSKVTEWNWV